MAEEKKERWLSWLAVTTVIFSACATLSTFRGSSFSTKAILAQTNAANQWAYFQAKSVKQHTCELSRDMLELQIRSLRDSTVVAGYRKQIDIYSAEIRRYDQEKDEAMQSAKTFEANRSDYQEHGSQFAMGVVFLQVAIVFSALAALMKNKPIWLLGCVSGSVGLYFFTTGVLWRTMP